MAKASLVDKGLVAVLEGWIEAEAAYKNAAIASAAADFEDEALEEACKAAADRAYGFRGACITIVDSYAGGLAEDIRKGIA